MNLRIALALVAAALFSTGASAGWSSHGLGGWMDGHCPLPDNDNDDMMTICLPVIIIQDDQWDIDFVCHEVPHHTPLRGGIGGDQDGDWFGDDDRPRRGMGLLYMLMNRMGDCSPCGNRGDDQPQPITAVPTPGAAVAGMAMLGLIAGRRRRKD